MSKKECKVSLERQSIYLSVQLGNYVNHCQCVPNDLALLCIQHGTAKGEGRSSRVGRLCGGRILPLATISLFSVSASVFVLLVCLFCLF